MTMQDMYPTTMSSQEQKAGFRVIQIENERNRWGDEPLTAEPQILQAVARPISGSDWFFKVQGPLGVGYRYLRYGVYDFAGADTLPYWLPVRDGDSDTLQDALAATLLPIHVQGVVPKTPPVVAEVNGRPMLCHEAGQIDSRQVARHKGVQAQVQGRTMDCFEIQQ